MVENNTKRTQKRCKLFAVALCLAGSVEALGVLYQTSSVPDATRPRPDKITKPAVIEFKGEIHPQLKMYFDNRFDMARRGGVDLLIIEITVINVVTAGDERPSSIFMHFTPYVDSFGRNSVC